MSIGCGGVAVGIEESGVCGWSGGGDAGEGGEGGGKGGDDIDDLKDPKLRFGEEIFKAELGGAANGNGLGDAVENEVCLVSGFSVNAGNPF